MSQTSRREFIRLGGGLAVGALGLPLAACGGSDTSDNAAGSGSSLTGAAAGTAALSMWSHEGDVAKYLDKRAKELAGKWQYEPIKLTTQPLQEMVPKVFAALSAKQDIPDILAIEINYFSRYMANDLAAKVLLDLTPSMGDEVGGLYTVSATDPYTLDGKIYAIGCDFPLMTYYYREDLAKKLGITFPVGTWDDLLDVGRRVAKPKGKYLSTLAVGKGGVGTAGISSQFINWLLQRGGTIFDKDGKTVTLDSPEAVDVMTFMVTALKDEVFLGVDALFGPADVAGFKTDKVIGHEGASWWRFLITRNLTEQAGKWRIVEMPRFAGGGSATATSGGTGYAITKQSKNQAAAWKLLHDSLMTIEGEREKFPQLSFLPVLKDAYQDDFFVNYEDDALGGQQKFKLYAEIAPEALAQPQSPYWNRALEALDREVAAAFSGNKSPTQAVKDAAASINKSISESA
jgi:ABC-type glycerol-3-phosphate transport system substrate-binding protein